MTFRTVRTTAESTRVGGRWQWKHAPQGHVIENYWFVYKQMATVG